MLTPTAITPLNQPIQHTPAIASTAKELIFDFIDKPTPQANSDDITIAYLSGSSGPLILFKDTSDKGEGLVNKMLNSFHLSQGGCFGVSHQDAFQNTRNSFQQAIQPMTPGELDEVRDAVVKKMAGDHVTRNDIQLLKQLYDDVDARMENRPYSLPTHHLKLPPIPPVTVGTNVQMARQIVKGDVAHIQDAIKAFKIVNIHLEKAEEYSDKAREFSKQALQILNQFDSKTPELDTFKATERLSTAQEYFKAVFDEKLYAHLAAETLKDLLESSPELTEIVNQNLKIAWQHPNTSGQQSVEILLNKAQQTLEKARENLKVNH